MEGGSQKTACVCPANMEEVRSQGGFITVSIPVPPSEPTELEDEAQPRDNATVRHRSLASVTAAVWRGIGLHRWHVSMTHCWVRSNPFL